MSVYQQQLHLLANGLKRRLFETQNHLITNHDRNAIIKYFGCFDTMLYLCLSNPNCCNLLSEESFASLQEFLQTRGLENKREADSPVSIKESQISKETSTSINGAVIPKNTNFSNLIEFYRHSLIINADPYNNFYHNGLKVSLEHTRFILDKVLYPKWYFLGSVTIAGLLYLLSQVYWYMTHDSGWIYLMMFVTAQSMLSTGGILYILSANVDIVSLLLQTFDFWYKMYNMSIAIVSTLFLDYYVSWISFAAANTTMVSYAIMSFLLDAVYISQVKKWILISFMACAVLSIVVYVYFAVENVHYWNPFDSEHTQMNLKSIAISSWMNLLLFVLKPMIITICRWCRYVIQHKKCARTNSIHRADGKLTQRSYLFHKRPIIKWHTEKHNPETTHSQLTLRDIDIIT